MVVQLTITAIWMHLRVINGLVPYLHVRGSVTSLIYEKEFMLRDPIKPHRRQIQPFSKEKH